jgi:hypothetical protein
VKRLFLGERDGFFHLGNCFRGGIGCEKDLEREKENFLVSTELGDATAMIGLGTLFDKDDPQRFVWHGRVAANGGGGVFMPEMIIQIRNFTSGIGHAKVIFASGQALKGRINNADRTIFRSGYNFDTYIGPANQVLHFYEFQLQSYRKAVDSWTIVGLRNKVVKDIRKMIGKMIWDAREEAAYSEVNCWRKIS